MDNNEGSLGRLISILYRSGQSYIGKKLEPYGIGSGQIVFLAELFAQDGSNQEELATFLQCDKATAARALQRLEKLGYVERKRSAADGRVNLVYLTDKAREFKPILFDVLSSWTATLSLGLSERERMQAFELLGRLVDNAAAATQANRVKR